MRHVRAPDDQLDALQLLKGVVPDLDRAGLDDISPPQTFPQLLQPERVRDRVAVDEADRPALRLPDSEVPARSAGAAVNVQVDELVAPLVPPDDVPRRVLAARIDDDDLERSFLHDEAVEEGGNVPRLVTDRRDDADEQRGS